MESSIPDEENAPPAIVSWDEVKVGKLIGKGAFSAVYCTDKKENWSSFTSLHFEDSSNTTLFDSDFEDLLTRTSHETDDSLGASDPSNSASDPSLVSEDSRLVLKCLHSSSRSDKAHQAMATRGLINEASILLSLAPHPNVTRLVGVSTELLNTSPDRGFLVFDRIADSLDRVLSRWQGYSLQHGQLLAHLSHDIQWKGSDLLQKSPLEWRIKYIILGIARGIAHLHTHSILHRDVKPSNIGLSYDGIIKILDFGSARKFPVPVTFRLTKGVGTRRYMAPEVDRSSLARDYGFPADVYSFSIVFWEVLTLRKAFEELKRASRGEIKNAIYRDKERPSLNLDLCERFRDALLTGWEHEPNVRPTMEDLSCRIEAEISGEGPLYRWNPDETFRQPSKLYFL